MGKPVIFSIFNMQMKTACLPIDHFLYSSIISKNLLFLLFPSWIMYQPGFLQLSQQLRQPFNHFNEMKLGKIKTGSGNKWKRWMCLAAVCPETLHQKAKQNYGPCQPHFFSPVGIATAVNHPKPYFPSTSVCALRNASHNINSANVLNLNTKGFTSTSCINLAMLFLRISLPLQCLSWCCSFPMPHIPWIPEKVDGCVCGVLFFVACTYTFLYLILTMKSFSESCINAYTLSILELLLTCSKLILKYSFDKIHESILWG